MINCILSLTRKKTESKHLNLGNLSLIIHTCVCVRVHAHMCIYLSLYGKASVYHAGDPGSVPGSGRSSVEGNGNPLQYYCLENPMDRGAW